MLVIFDDARAWQIGQGADRAMPLEPTRRPEIEVPCEIEAAKRERPRAETQDAEEQPN